MSSDEIYDKIINTKNDKNKIELIEKYEGKLKGADIASIAKTMFFDRNKIGLIEKYEDKLKGADITSIIGAMALDKNKLKIIEKYKDKLKGADIASIARSMIFDKNKLKIIGKYKENLEGTDIASIYIYKDKINLKVIERYGEKLEGKDVANIVRNIEKDKIKIESIDKYGEKLEGTDIASIVRSIEDDEMKIELIDKYGGKLEGKDVASIIRSMEEDKIKIELIDKYGEKLERKDITNIIGSIEENKRIELIEKYKEKLEGIDIASIIRSIEEDKRIELIEKYEDKIEPRNLLSICMSFKSENNKKLILAKYKDVIKNYVDDSFKNIGTPIDNIEEMYTTFGDKVFDGIELLTKECEQSLGKENVYNLIKYYVYAGEKIEIGKILESPEVYKFYEEFRKRLFKEKQMKVMDVRDSIVEFNDNTNLIKECTEAELNLQEEELLKAVLKEKNVEIESKEDLSNFPQKRQEKIEEMINKDSENALIYLLTGMTQKEYDEKLKLYINDKQINSTINDFDELDSDLSIIKAVNEFIELIRAMEEDKRKDTLKTYNKELANEFSESGSMIASVRSVFEDIDIKLRRTYGKELSESLTEYKLPDAKFDEKDREVEIIELKGEEFKLLIHGIDAYGEGTGKFEKRAVGKSYICTSLISDKKLDRAEAKRYYGFRNIGSNALIQQGKSDIDSYAQNTNSLEVSALYGVEFDIADDFNEGEDYNEIDLWREYLGDDGKMRDIWPEYIVCFNNVTQEDKEEAKHLGIPIVLINEKAYEKNIKKNKEIQEDVNKEESVEQIPQEYAKTQKSMLEILKESANKCSALAQQEALMKIVSEMEKQLKQEKDKEVVR